MSRSCKNWSTQSSAPRRAVEWLSGGAGIFMSAISLGCIRFNKGFLRRRTREKRAHRLMRKFLIRYRI